MLLRAGPALRPRARWLHKIQHAYSRPCWFATCPLLMTAKALLLVDEGSRLSCYVLYRGAAHVYFRRMPPALHGVLAARYESWSARRRLGQALVLCANNIKAAVGSPSNKPDMAWLLHGFCLMRCGAGPSFTVVWPALHLLGPTRRFGASSGLWWAMVVRGETLTALASCRV